MPITRLQKEQHLVDLKDLISKSSMIIVWDYAGIDAEEFTKVRSVVRDNEATVKVYKNRIAKIAFEQAGKEEILEHLVGPSSFLFVEDEESDALRELNKFVKEHDSLEFKAGYIDGKFYDADGIAEMAGLPSKSDLLSMLLSVLQGNLRNLAYAISQVATQAPEGDVVKEEPVAEATVEETTKEVVEEAKEEASEEIKEEN